MLLLQLPHKMWTIFLFSTYSLLCSALVCRVSCVCVCKILYNTFSSLLVQRVRTQNWLHIVRLRLDEINIYPYSIFCYVQQKSKTIIYLRVPYASCYICIHIIHVCLLLWVLLSKCVRVWMDVCVSAHSFKIR